MADIDLSGFDNWDPIGDSTDPFTGVFDGNGHVIKNLCIDREDEDYVGLFGVVESAEIKNVGVIDVNVRGNNTVGSLIGSSGGGLFPIVMLQAL